MTRYGVERKCDGAGALETARAFKPEVAFIDLNMPRMATDRFLVPHRRRELGECTGRVPPLRGLNHLVRSPKPSTMCRPSAEAQKSREGRMVTNARIDRALVTLGSDTELLYWEAKLGASPVAIAAAISCVGTDPSALRQWLVARRLARLRPGEDDGAQERPATRQQVA